MASQAIQIGLVLFSALITVIIGLYGFIFRTFMQRLEKLEDRPIPTPAFCNERFEKIEKKQEEMNPIWIEVKEKLARIEVTLDYLAKDKKL